MVTGVDLWRRLHELADQVVDVPAHRQTHVSVLVDKLAQLIDGDDDEPDPPTFAW